MSPQPLGRVYVWEALAVVPLVVLMLAVGLVGAAVATVLERLGVKVWREDDG